MPLTRREFVGACVGGLVTSGLIGRVGFAGDVPWLAEVSRRPEKVPEEGQKLAPLLQDAAGKPIRTVDEWQKERERIRQAWMEFLGPMPAERPDVKLEVLSEDKPEGFTRQLVRYESETGLPVEGYLLRPNAEVPGKDQNGKRAGIVALHPTSKDTIDEIAGVKGRESRAAGPGLARKGFIVFCPRCFLWQSVEKYDQAVDNFKKRHPQTLGMHKMLWDAMRGVDVLVSLKDAVDPQRIGAFGHSLGAKETLYLCAFDDRVATGVASEGGVGFNFTNWDAPWYLGPGFKEPGFKLNHHQLLGMIAPRPFLILAGESGAGAADGDRTWPYVEAALPTYRLYGSAPRLGLYNHRKGHTVDDEIFGRVTEWLAAYLNV